MAAKVNLSNIHRGDTVPYHLTFTDGTSPLNMQGKTLIMTFKVSSLQLDVEAALTKTVVLDSADPLAALGQVSYQLESSETAQLQAGLPYQYGIRIIEPGGTENIEKTFMYGTIVVEDA